jgi:hypothetical protein
MAGRRMAAGRAVALAVVMTALVLPALAQRGRERITAPVLVREHLRSLGTPEAIHAAQSRVAQGAGRLQLLYGGFGDLAGPAALAAEGVKLLFQIDFNYAQYPREEASFDGDRVYVPRIMPEGYSRLGQFLYTHKQVMGQGLLGGTLSTGWALLRIEDLRPNLRYHGLRRIDGVQLHRLEYGVHRGPGDLRINLYFEPESFRHVLTTYNLEVRTGIRTDPEAPLGEQDARFRQELRESFSEFREVDGLTVPTKWLIRYTADEDRGNEMGGRTTIWEWLMEFSSIEHNRPIAAEAFVIPQ